MGLWAPGSGASWSSYGVSTTSQVQLKLQKATTVTGDHVAVRRSLTLGSGTPRFSVFGVGVGDVHLTLEVSCWSLRWVWLGLVGLDSCRLKWASEARMGIGYVRGWTVQTPLLRTSSNRAS